MSKKRLISQMLAVVMAILLVSSMVFCVGIAAHAESADVEDATNLFVTLDDSSDSGVCQHKEVVIPGYAATCTEKGLSDGVKCVLCGEFLEKQVLLDSKGHTYDNGSDTDCNDCGQTRDPQCNHEYDDDCDRSCNVCGATRYTVGHTGGKATCNSRAVCETCGKEYGLVDNRHTFGGGICDTTCDVCGFEREVSHSWSNDCDGTCNVCGATREADHQYSDVWSTDGAFHWRECDICYNKGYKAEHNYENACDGDCADCGYVRFEEAVHIYDNGCDTDCNSCGLTRVTAHKWENECDERCDECGATRQGNHQYNNACAVKCNNCEHVRETVGHVYDNACDTTCNECNAERAAEHTYDNACDAYCNECGLLRTIQHSFVEGTWKSNAYTHWEECSVCGAKQRDAAHTFSAVCSTECSDCGYVREDAENAHVYVNDCDADCEVCFEERFASAQHTYQWTYSDIQHWESCTKCGAMKEGTQREVHRYEDGSNACSTCGHIKGGCDHGYDNDCDTTCNICGEVREPLADHVFGDTYKYDENGLEHWYECSVCGYKKNQQAHTFAKVSVDENTHNVACVTCGYIQSSGEKHSFDKYGECACSYQSTCAHTGGTATCSTRATCAICGFEYGDFAAHEMIETSPATAANCANTGLTAGQKCVNCDFVIDPEVIPATGKHTPATILAVKPTCTTEGSTAGLSCTVCGTTIVQPQAIGATGHSYVTIAVTPATCENMGSVSKQCSKCGDVQTSSTDALGHVESNWTVSESATCFSEGSQYKYCVTCSKVLEEEIIPQLSHDWIYRSAVTAGCTTDGYTIYVCSLCNSVEQRDYQSPLGHSESDWIVDREATCIANGARHKVCNTCGIVTVSETIAASGQHTWSDTSFNSVAHWNICSVCFDTDAYVPHSYNNGQCDCGYTCEHTGGNATCQILATCDRCGCEYGDYASHIGGAAPTCDNAQTCNVCGDVINEALGHDEIIDAAVAPTCSTVGLTEGKHCGRCGTVIVEQQKVSANGHSYDSNGVCTECGETMTGGESCEHEYAGCEATTCTKCGEDRTAPGHMLVVIPGYAASCTATGLTDGYKCAACGEITTEQTTIDAKGHTDVVVPAVAPTCTATGLTAGSRCVDCGITTLEQTEVASLGHDNATIETNSTCVTAGSITTVCRRCGTSSVQEKALAAHTYGSWIVDAEPTCIGAGAKHQECAVCNEVLGTAEIPATGHNYTAIVTAPTCTTEGYTTFTCTICSNTETKDHTAALGHVSGGWVVTVAPFCETAGTKEERCSTCNTVIGSEEIPALGHKETVKVTAPTCTSEGYTTYTCANCSTSRIEYSGEYAAHTPGVWIVELEAGCDYDGSKYTECVACGERIETQSIPAIGHAYIATTYPPTATEAGYTEHKCANCGDSYQDSPVDVHVHIPGAWIIDQIATCDTDGSKHQVCSACGETLATETINAYGHDHVIVEYAATCETEGSRTTYCNNCDYQNVEIIAKVAHTSGGWITVGTATCKDTAYKYEICAVCGIEIDRQNISMTDHNFIITVTAPTCTAEGYTTSKCSVCGVESKSDYKVALGHDTLGGYIIDQKATCTEVGSKHVVCSRCGEEDVNVTEEIPATGHQNVSVVTAPTCTEQGYTTTVCVKCGFTTDGDYVSATGHTAGEWIIENAATCTDMGTKYTKCVHCGVITETGTINALGHNYVASMTVAPSCKDQTNGYTWYVCTGCGDSYTDDEVVYSHSFGDDNVCDSCGFKKEANCEHSYDNDCDATCNNCGELREVSHVEVTLPAVEASCQNTGLTEGKQCSVCGVITVAQKVSPKTAHTYANACDADCNACGATRTPSAHVYDNNCDADCNVCGATRIPSDHVYSNACDADCNVCGKTRTPSAHVYSSNCDATCNVCGAERVASDHVYDNACDSDCNSCGARRVTSHVYDDATDEYCNVCNEWRDTSCDHVYDNDTCDADCNKCGATREVIGHKGGVATCKNKAICELCNQYYGDYEPHNPNIEAATCTSNKVCLTCGSVIESAFGHSYVDVVTDPTCTAQGFTTHTCSTCGDTYNDSYVSALGHNIVDVPAKDPTCTETGLTAGKKCDRCGTVTVAQSTVQMVAHTYDNEDDLYCNVCNYKRNPACPHAYDNDCDAECNLCGETRVVRHDYDTVYSSDATNHWYACKVCGVKNGANKHIFTNVCDTTCNTCNYERTVSHSWSSAWTKDATGHWHKCSICGVAGEVSGHVYDSTCDSKCDTCNYTRTVDHTYGAEYKTDGTYHWYVCTTCNTATTGKGVHVYTNACDTECNTCGYTRSTTHNWSTTYTKDETGHWYVCTICSAKGTVGAHKWDNGCDTACNTCSYTRTTKHIYDNACDTSCNECGATRTVPHNYATIYSSNASQHWYECGVCGAKKGAANHVYSTSCDESCNTCGYVRTTTHSWSTTWTKNKDGHWYVCKNCSTVKEVLAHAYENDCDSYCETCGYSRTISHKYSSTYSSNTTAHWYECGVCGARKNEADHAFTNACDTTCNTCGYERTTTHSYGSTLKYNAGYHWKECSVCGDQQNMTEHVFTNDCDTSCSGCAYTRTTTHVYDNACDKTCNICGATRTTSHTYGADYMYDSSNHWKECTVCQTKASSAAHTYASSSATECSTCGYSRNVNHNYSSSWSSDANYHWHACTDAGCSAVSSRAAHNYSNNCDSSCNTCGYTRTTTHTWAAAWTKDASGHWHKCLICGEADTVASHVWDDACDTDCNTCAYTREAAHDYTDDCDATCNTCGKERTVPHSYGDAYKNDATGHWYQCDLCGNVKGKASHSWSSNCDSMCDTCYYLREVEHTWQTTYTKDATGHWQVCSVCREKSAVENHEWDNNCDTACNVCNFGRTTSHVYATDYSSDSSYHWYRCTSCGVQKDKAAHNYDNACDPACNSCGAARTTSHSYATTYTKDSTSHWYACTKCGAKSQENTHAWDNACDTSCDVCGQTRTISHKYGSSYTSDDNNHWKQCTVCGAKTGTGSHQYSNTCDSSCNTCGFTRTTTHSWAQTYTSDASQHWNACVVCGEKSNTANHVWANACDTECGTCGYDRTITHSYTNTCDTTCNVCGAIRSITHSYKNTYDKDDTYHWYTCSVCGAKKSSAAHTYSNSTDTTCNNCGYTRDLAACQHTYDNDCGDATCNNGCGYTRSSFPADHTFDNLCDTTCNVCNTVARTATHTYDHGCDNDCNVCGATRTTSHSISSAYSTDATYHWKECVNCGYKQGNGTHGYSSTCDESCNTCGYTRATEHTWKTSYTTDNDTHWYACSVCQAKKNQAAHVYDNGCDNACNVCGKTRSVSHTYGTTYVTDATNHWYACTSCGAKKSTAAHSFKMESIDNAEHKTYCTVCKYVKAVDSHSYDANNLCDCGHQKVELENYATSIDFIKKNGPYTSYGSNSVIGEQIVYGYSTDLDGKISFSGWCVADSGIAGYYYAINDGAWQAINVSGLQDATSAHLSAASGVAGVSVQAPVKNCVFKDGSILQIDLSSYYNKTIKLSIAARTNNGNYVNIISLADMKVWKNPFTDISDYSGLNNYSIDSIKVDGTLWSVSSAEGGTANAQYAMNHTALQIKRGQLIGVFGWAGFDTTISSVGYCYATSTGTVVQGSLASAEQGVIEAGGANAKRFLFDIDTSNLTEGTHRVYFVLTLGNGTKVVYHYMDLYVNGTVDNYDGSTAGETNPSVASKDQYSGFSTAPSSVSGSTVTSAHGLRYSYSGATYNSGSYRFTFSSGFTMSSITSSGMAEEFNRLKFWYCTTQPLAVTMTYVNTANQTLTDTFYLEPSGGTTFTMLIQGYQDGAMAKSITNLSIKSCNGSSTNMMIAAINGDKYEVYPDITYIQNSKYKVGAKLSWGGALYYFEDKKDGNSSLGNVINVYDVGRLIQQSWYSTQITGNYNGSAWKYNPVQGGDWRNNPSRIMDVVVTKYSMYIKSQPMDWGCGGNGQTPTITPSYMENWYTVYTDRVRVDNRFFDFSGRMGATAVNQEIPAMYFVCYLDGFAYDSGSGNWSSTSITKKTSLPFWGPGSGTDNDYNANYNALTRFAVSGSETWGCWYNTGNNFSVGFYVPGIQRFISGRNQYYWYPKNTSPYAPGCVYTAAGLDNKFKSYQAYTYSYLLTTGNSPEAVRATFASHYSSIPSPTGISK